MKEKACKEALGKCRDEIKEVLRKYDISMVAEEYVGNSWIKLYKTSTEEYFDRGNKSLRTYELEI